MSDHQQTNGDGVDPPNQMSLSIPRKKSLASTEPLSQPPPDHYPPLPSMPSNKPLAPQAMTTQAPVSTCPPQQNPKLSIPRKKTSSTTGATKTPSIPPNLPSHAPSFSRPSIPPSIPHKQSGPPPHSLLPPPSKIIKIQSEVPFVVKIKTRGVPTDQGIRLKSARVVPKRKRPHYEEQSESDPDDILTDSGDDKDLEADPRMRLKKLKTVVAPVVASATISTTSSSVPVDDGIADAAIAVDGVEAPPPGVLANLWYSREPVLHVWVVEKVFAFRTRPVTELEWKDPNASKFLDPSLAQLISTKGLVDHDVWRNQVQRMEFSRVNPVQCPMVMQLAAKLEKETAGDNARFCIAPPSDSREEVLLVKWRGRSYLHCSWERMQDLEKFDQSNNTARNKIRRYFQAQEIAFGMDWKVRSTPISEGDDLLEEDIFPPQNIEVERILACDESEMNLAVFAKQRAINMREEATMLKKREAEGTDMHLKEISVFDKLPLLTEGEDPWDPEDYVRYVVKWKSLQYSEMTWEYWKDIKREAVNQAEDFWFRQKAPSMEELRHIQSKSHPHIREFRKLTESPAFAISKRDRPVADLGDGFEDSKDDQDEKPGSGFLLRSYQLEGVNWLLFNWWNKRSCILADEMVSSLMKEFVTTHFLVNCFIFLSCVSGFGKDDPISWFPSPTSPSRSNKRTRPFPGGGPTFSDRSMAVRKSDLGS